MTHDQHSPSTRPQPAGQPLITEAGLQSTARRRTLLRGLGRAAVLAGATVPLRSLATNDRLRLPKANNVYTMCTLSGQNSVVHSASALYTDSCTGKAVAHYQSAGVGSNKTWAGWPKNSSNQPHCLVGGVSHLPMSSKFRDIFGGWSSLTMIGTLVDSSPTSVETTWIVALLNANTQAYFPFTPVEIVDIYRNGSSVKKASAVELFKSIELVG